MLLKQLCKSAIFNYRSLCRGLSSNWLALRTQFSRSSPPPLRLLTHLTRYLRVPRLLTIYSAKKPPFRVPTNCRSSNLARTTHTKYAIVGPDPPPKSGAPRGLVTPSPQALVTRAFQNPPTRLTTSLEILQDVQDVGNQPHRLDSRVITGYPIMGGAWAWAWHYRPTRTSWMLRRGRRHAPSQPRQASRHGRVLKAPSNRKNRSTAPGNLHAQLPVSNI
jgi:hypothetical protein